MGTENTIEDLMSEETEHMRELERILRDRSKPVNMTRSTAKSATISDG
jgi:rubrerythrin